MVDKSLAPCKVCKHVQNSHSKHYARCYVCESYNIRDRKASAYHAYEREENLVYLEWLYSQKNEQNSL